MHTAIIPNTDHLAIADLLLAQGTDGPWELRDGNLHGPRNWVTDDVLAGVDDDHRMVLAAEVAAIEAEALADMVDDEFPAYPCPDDPDGLHHVGCGCDFY